MTDHPSDQTKIEERCPVCGIRLVRIMQNGELHGLAHGNPTCEPYKTLSAKEFHTKYLMN